jgi:acetyl esterase/lipase
VASVLHVTAQTPPFFIWSTTPDTTVSSMNATNLYNALKLAGVPVELHIFDTGSHGTGLAQQYPTLKVWPLLMDAWMQEHGWMP